MTLTADQLRRARRALGVTQAKLADETGVNATLIKHFETYRLSALPDSAQKELQDYFDSNGVDMSQLARSQDDAAPVTAPAAKPGSAVVQPIPRAALLPQRLGFLVSNTISDDEIEDLLQKMDDNDERIYELVKKETQTRNTWSCIGKPLSITSCGPTTRTSRAPLSAAFGLSQSPMRPAERRHTSRSTSPRT
jgi:transcriptional regulator with XRE-family HTH domain